MVATSAASAKEVNMMICRGGKVKDCSSTAVGREVSVDMYGRRCKMVVRMEVKCQMMGKAV